MFMLGIAFIILIEEFLKTCSVIIGVSYSYVKLNEELDQLAEDPANSIVTFKEIIEKISLGPTMMDNYIESWEHAKFS